MYTCDYLALAKSLLHTVNLGAQVLVLLFGNCTFLQYELCGVLIIMGYFSTW